MFNRLRNNQVLIRNAKRKELDLSINKISCEFKKKKNNYEHKKGNIIFTDIRKK